MDEIILFGTLGLAIGNFINIVLLNKKTNKLYEDVDTLHAKMTNKFKGVGDAITKLNNNINDAAKYNQEIRVNDNESIDEKISTISSQVTWHQTELFNLNKAIQDITKELYGNDMPVENTEEDGVYNYPLAIVDSLRLITAKLLDLENLYNTWYEKNNGFHIAIGKKVGKIQEQLKK